MANYRPISLSSIFNKLLEKIMYVRLCSHLHHHHVLNPYQFGFRRNYSTTLALVHVVDGIYQHLDNNE
jgi:Reverse transcriptase (RNA-dependent DNA polymerase)